IGNDMAIAVANSHSNLDLCTMMTVMSQRLSQNIELLANVSRVFAHRCIEGISANIDVLQRYAESSPAIATTLNLLIGYETAAERLRSAPGSDSGTGLNPVAGERPRQHHPRVRSDARGLRRPIRAMERCHLEGWVRLGLLAKTGRERAY